MTELLWGLYWLPIRIQYKVILLVNKAFTSSNPPYLSNMLIPKKQMRATRSSLKVNIFDIPKTCNNANTAKAFAVAGLVNRTTLFKKKMKTLLFRSFY